MQYALDVATDHADAPTAQAIESARREQLEALKAIRRRIATGAWRESNGPGRPIRQVFAR